MFTVIKLLLYSPRKDHCNVYMGYKVWKVSEDDYQIHQDKKSSARDSINRSALECHQTDNTVLKIFRKSCLHLVYMQVSFTIKQSHAIITTPCMMQTIAMCNFWSECATDSSFNTFSVLYIIIIHKMKDIRQHYKHTTHAFECVILDGHLDGPHVWSPKEQGSRTPTMMQRGIQQHYNLF